MGGIVKRKLAFVVGTAAGICALNGDGQASETVSYQYDALGRLKATVHSGGVNNGQAQSLCYDPGGNRTQYQSSAAGTLASCGGGTPPPPPPPPGNQPPTTVNDTLSLARCTTSSKNVTANDSDPEGNLPLVLVGVTPGTKGAATVASSTTVQYESYGPTGTDVLTYTVRDSLGATSTGTLTVSITSGTCL